MAEKDVTVKVVLHAPGSAQNFHFETSLPMNGTNVLVFKNEYKGDHFKVWYEIDDTLNPGWRFRYQGSDHLKDNLWVHTKDHCPSSQCEWDQFIAQSAPDQGRKLVVKNRNEFCQDFFYTLRLFKDGEVLELDPGGENQDGGIVPSQNNFAAYALVGAIAASASAAIAARAFDAPTLLIYAVGGAVFGALAGLVAGRM